VTAEVREIASMERSSHEFSIACPRSAATHQAHNVRRALAGQLATKEEPWFPVDRTGLDLAFDEIDRHRPGVQRQ
jgi:hypothetical protein